MRRLDELIAAATLLTRLPVAGLIGGRPWPAAAAAVWAYPLVGALVGAVGGAVLAAVERLGTPPAVAAILAIAAMLLLTGGLHEDGLADTADGFGGGLTVARKLEVMRDSRIGSYGALALILAIGLRAAALASLPPALAWPALIAAGGLGRGAIIVVLLRLGPARADGTAAALRDLRSNVALAGLALAAVASLALPGRSAAVCVVGAALAAFGMAALARRQIGGHTGDVLGAAVVVADCVVLCLASTLV